MSSLNRIPCTGRSGLGTGGARLVVLTGGGTHCRARTERARPVTQDRGPEGGTSGRDGRVRSHSNPGSTPLVRPPLCQSVPVVQDGADVWSEFDPEHLPHLAVPGLHPPPILPPVSPVHRTPGPPRPRASRRDPRPQGHVPRGQDRRGGRPLPTSTGRPVLRRQRPGLAPVAVVVHSRHDDPGSSDKSIFFFTRVSFPLSCAPFTPHPHGSGSSTSRGPPETDGHPHPRPDGAGVETQGVSPPPRTLPRTPSSPTWPPPSPTRPPPSPTRTRPSPTRPPSVVFHEGNRRPG